MEILLLLTMGLVNIFCFLVGARVGQKVSRDERVEVPNLNPVAAVREHRERREADRKQERIDTIMHNIDSYDGTSAGQKEIPRW